MNQTDNLVAGNPYRRHAASFILVGLQLAGIVGACWPVGLVNRGHPLWLLSCLLGAAFGLWALGHNNIGLAGIFPEPRREMRLITQGPYALARHPMYGSLIVMMAGIAGYNGHAINWIAACSIIPVVIAKSRMEERLLQRVFGEYEHYMNETPRRFLPYLM